VLNILFFDDFPYASENRLFRTLVSAELKDIAELKVEKTLPTLEAVLKRHDVDILILDLMASNPHRMKWFGSQNPVPEDLAGVGILEHCRNGSYGDKSRRIPILIRSARGETQVKKICEQKGATCYFRVGTDDMILVSWIKHYASEIKIGGQ
jgi:CheY-like chemotaxis protein